MSSNLVFFPLWGKTSRWYTEGWTPSKENGKDLKKKKKDFKELKFTEVFFLTMMDY